MVQSGFGSGVPLARCRLHLQNLVLYRIAQTPAHTHPHTGRQVDKLSDIIGDSLAVDRSIAATSALLCCCLLGAAID